jgi:hypothetical protein
METTRDHFTCLWCGTAFLRRHPCGRKPCYCTHTCRQRAYEARRRGLHDPGRPAAAPPSRSSTLPTRRSYEAGRRYHLRHALRPDGLPDPAGRRVTLCGTYAAPIRPPFDLPDRSPHRHCHVCLGIAARHPPPRTIEPSRDLATLTNLASRLRADLVTGVDLRPTAVALVTYCWPAQTWLADQAAA